MLDQCCLLPGIDVVHGQGCVPDGMKIAFCTSVNLNLQSSLSRLVIPDPIGLERHHVRYYKPVRDSSRRLRIEWLILVVRILHMGGYTKSRECHEVQMVEQGKGMSKLNTVDERTERKTTLHATFWTL